MKRTRFGRRGGLTRDAESLIWLASGIADSGSRAEDRYWESLLAQTIDALIEQDDEDAINTALDHLYSTNLRAYDELADFVESRTECGLRGQNDYDVLLVAAPVLAASRYRIPATTIPAAMLSNLRVHLQAHVLADGAQLALADFLFSPDQLPQGYCATARFADVLGMAARAGNDFKVNTDGMAETTQFLSDTRYLLAAVAVPTGQAMFAWQEEDGNNRDQALQQWRAQGGASLAPLLPGCTVDVVLPEAYFAASRQADKASRPYAIQASIAFLSTTLEVPASGIRAVIAPFHDQQLQEFRIGFTLSGQEQVLHGVVWPLLGAEDEETDSVMQIEAVLKDAGVHEILTLEHRFPLEYCDDCGAPLYPSPDGEPMHAELPEEQAEQIPRHLH